MEGGEYLRANSWSEDKRSSKEGSRGGSRGSSRSTTPSVQDEARGRTNGHKHASSSHKSREHGSSNHKASRDRWSDCPSASWRSQRTHSGDTRLLEQDEEKLSNYEMEMRPLQPMDSNSQKPYGLGEERHGHSGEARSHTLQRQRPSKTREAREREAAWPSGAREGKERKEGPAPDSMQKLDSLSMGDKLEARPLRRDLTLSPPQKSSPIALEHDDDKKLTQLKANSVRTPPLTHTFIATLSHIICLCTHAENHTRLSNHLHVDVNCIYTAFRHNCTVINDRRAMNVSSLCHVQT